MNILIFGDSIAWGAYDGEKGGWVNRLKTSLWNHDCFVYNLGISGDTSYGVLRRMSKQIEYIDNLEDETAIIIAIGINDASTDNKGKFAVPLDEYIQNMHAIYEEAKKYARKILFIGLTAVDGLRSQPVEWDDNLFYSPINVDQYDTAWQMACDRLKIPFLSLIDMDARNTEDGTHPGIAMHAEIARRVKLQLHDWIKPNM